MTTRDGVARRSLWVIADHGPGCLGMFTLNDGGVLPVFSYEEEAQAFLRLGALGTSWKARETTARELVSIPYGLCSGVEKVALDPPTLDGAVVGLVSQDRKEFARTLVGEPCPGVRNGNAGRERAS